MLKDLVKKCRSYRRFYEDTPISREELEEMVDTARLTASTANSQALKYRLVDSPEECDRLFPCLAWAGALKIGTALKRESSPPLISLSSATWLLEKTSSGMKASLPRPSCWQPRKWATAAV